MNLKKVTNYVRAFFDIASLVTIFCSGMYIIQSVFSLIGEVVVVGPALIYMIAVIWVIARNSNLFEFWYKEKDSINDESH